MASGHQTIVIGYPEPIWFEFRDDDGNLINVSTPKVDIYDPDKNLLINSTSLSNQDTGIYYYTFNLSSAVSTALGMYQAWPRGTYGGVLISMDEPRYIEVVSRPMGTGRDYEFLQSVRRFIGDTDGSNYRVSTGELAGLVYDALEAIQAKYISFTGQRQNYTVQVSNQGISFNNEPTEIMAHLIKCQVAILMLRHYLQIYMSQPGIINVGDVRISNASQVRQMIRQIENDEQRLEDEITNVITRGMGAAIIKTFGDGTGSYSGYWHE